MKERTRSSGSSFAHPSTVLPPLRSERLLDQVRERVRYLHYNIRTEQAYVHWARAFVRFHRLRHPREMAGAEVEAFLAWLAAEQGVSVSTHRQALSALLFLYRQVLGVELPWMGEVGRPKARMRLPVVLSTAEVAAVLACIDPAHRLFAELLHGTGMRLLGGLRLRVKDVDFERRAIVVREGKGAKDRVVMLPASLAPSLHEQMAHARRVWRKDRDAGAAGVHLPDALARKYPRAEASWMWSWVFPQDDRSVDPRAERSGDGEGDRAAPPRRHHAFDQTFQRAFVAEEPLPRISWSACSHATPSSTARATSAS